MTKADWGEKPEKPKPEFLFIYPDSQVRMRILGDMPYEFSQHWFPAVGKLYKCAGRNCLACRNGHKATFRYLLPVLAKFDTGSEGRVWSFGKMVFNSLKAYRFDPDLGDLRDYDLVVTKKINNGINRQEVYPHRKNEPLSDADKIIAKKFMKSVDLDKMAGPATNEALLAAMGQKAIFSKDSR